MKNPFYGKYLKLNPPSWDHSKLFEENREKLHSKLSPKFDKSVVLLQGGVAVNHYSTDVEYVFRQEPYFHYLFGVVEPGFYGALCVGSGESILFMPRLPESYAAWMGKILSPEQMKAKYKVTHVHYVDELSQVLSNLECDQLLTLYGKNTDSNLYTEEAVFEGISSFQVDNSSLFPIITECRVIKSPKEIEVLRYVAHVSAEAHKHVMKNVRPGMFEYQAEALFMNFCYFLSGARHTGYTCICGSGENSAVLHYGHAGAPNDKKIKNGDMCLFDMGASFLGYCADVTASFPANGNFSKLQISVYNAVLNARNKVLKSMKPGVSWLDMHKLAQKTILMDLLVLGAVQGELDGMIKCGLGGVFMPHGLGHLLGLDVHDVGGYTDDTPPRPEESWLKCLRTSRDLEEGMVITVEPGCYFIDHILDKALADPTQSQFLVPEKIKQLRGFGGVRIEDDVLVTKDGAEVLSVLPRTIQEIENFISGKFIC